MTIPTTNLIWKNIVLENFFFDRLRSTENKWGKPAKKF